MRRYKLLLLLFPREFRARFGRDMADVFADRRRAARRQGLPALTAFWIRATADSIAHGLAERRHHRPGKGDAIMLTLIQDARFALRLLRERPGFATAALLTLALGVGLNVAIFSAVRVVLLSDLPYPEADRLVWVTLKTSRTPAGGMAPSVAAFEALARQSSIFSIAAASEGRRQAALTGAGDAEVIGVNSISREFAAVTGLRAVHGRFFGPADFTTDSDAALISDRFWMSRFGGGSDVIGRPLHLQGTIRRIVGVVPDGFDIGSRGDRRTDVWLPLVWTLADRSPVSGSYGLSVVARLIPGIDVAEANRRLDVNAPALPPGSESSSIRGAVATPLSERYARGVRPGLLLLQGVSGLLLLITCTNLATLFLAHGATRSREFGVRSALGASRWRLVRQITVELGVLALGAGALGVLLAYAAVPALVSIAGWSLPRAEEVGVRGAELMAGLGLSLAAALAGGALPAVMASRVDPHDSLRGTLQTTPGRTTRLVTGTLVVAQVVVAVIMLTAAGLLIRSFARVVSLPLGFDPNGLVVAELPLSGYSGDRARLFAQQLEDRLQAQFGAEAIAIGTSLPYTPARMGPATPLLPSGTYGAFTAVPYRWVTHGYFAALDIAILRGRGFSESDAPGSPRAIVVNETFVRQFGEGRDLLGSRMRLGPLEATVVGVVADTRNFDLAQPPAPAVHWSLVQRPQTDLAVAVRGRDVAAVPQALREAVRGIDPDIPLVRLESIDQKIARTQTQRRFYLTMLSLFGGVGVALVAIGIYGVVARATSARTREIGIRTALGARAGHVRALVTREGLRPVLVGLVAGLAGAWWVTGLLQANTVFASQLYEITAHNPPTFVAAALLLLIIAAVACWIPASRASRIDPARTLRTD